MSKPPKPSDPFRITVPHSAKRDGARPYVKQSSGEAAVRQGLGLKPRSGGKKGC